MVYSKYAEYKCKFWKANGSPRTRSIIEPHSICQSEIGSFHKISYYEILEIFCGILFDFFRQYLLGKNWWTLEQDAEFKKSAKKEVLQGIFSISNFEPPIIFSQALSSAEKKKKPSIESMFDDVYDVRTPELERQYAELLEHLDEYGDKYNLDIYHKS